MSLDTDYTSLGFNSYLSTAEVDSRVRALQAVYGATACNKYLGLDEDLKEALILRATAEANARRFKGTLNASVVTEMVLPRVGLTHVNGNPIASDAVPEFIKAFIAERTLELAAVTPKIQETRGSNTRVLQLGSLRKEVDTQAGAAAVKKPSQYASFKHLARHVYATGGGVVRA